MTGFVINSNFIPKIAFYDLLAYPNPFLLNAICLHGVFGFFRNYNFNKSNVECPARIARIAKEVGVEKFIHLSHLNAREELPSIFVKGGSKFLHSKVLGKSNRKLGNSYSIVCIYSLR